MNNEQKTRALQIWQKYFEAGEAFLNASLEYTQTELDRQRTATIPKVKGEIQRYISGEIELNEFKSSVDSINKRNRLWGFKGINGQMFFNMLVKTSALGNKTTDFETLLKRCLVLPVSPEQAASLMKEFADFTNNLSQFVDDRRAAPKVGSVPFFLSYFWQIFDPQTYPVYYTSMVNILQEYNLWMPSPDIKESYLSFYRLNHELLALFNTAVERELTLWDVEHAFWYMAQPELPAATPDARPPTVTPPLAGKQIIPHELADSYIPPVVAILPRLAVNDPELAEICKQMGSSIDVVFEKRLDTLFQMLGYETELLGQGHGRVPDGVAICREFHYAIGYDAKVRQQNYSMGTEQRKIQEYINRLTERLRRQGIRQIYFMLISSAFSGDHDDVIRSLKMETDVREILLVEVGALVALLEAKLRDPLLTLGPDGIQRLLADSGVLTEADVKEFRGF